MTTLITHISFRVTRALRAIWCHHTTLPLLFCGLALTLGSTAGSASAISYVQGGYSTPQSAKGTVVVKYSAAQLAGDLNVIAVGWNDSSATIKSVVDSSGNVYSLAAGPTVVSGALTQSIYFAKNIRSAAAGVNSVTIAFSKAAAYPDIRILEYSGADPANPVDVVASKSGNSTASSVSASTTYATDLLFAANVVQSATLNAGSGFTARLLTQPDADIAEDKAATVAGSYTAAATLNTADPWIMQMVAFRAASASGTSPAALSALSCTGLSITGSGADTCTATLTAPAASGGFIVNLASNNVAVVAPASVTVVAGAISASFPVSIMAVSTTQSATITANAASISKSFTLQVNAAVATLSIGATSISFGDVQVNTSATQSVTLTSIGSEPVTVNSAAVSGSGFSITGSSFPLTLNPNQSTTLSVEFMPTASGATTGQLMISSNSSSNSNMAVNLTGTGSTTSYSVSVSWNPPSNSPDPIAGYNIYRSSSGSSSYQLVSSLSSGQVAYTDNNVQIGATYNYVVKSIDGSGNESSPSNTANVTIQ